MANLLFEMQSKLQAGARDLNLGVALAARSCLRAEGKMMKKIETLYYGRSWPSEFFS